MSAFGHVHSWHTAGLERMSGAYIELRECSGGCGAADPRKLPPAPEDEDYLIGKIRAPGRQSRRR